MATSWRLSAMSGEQMMWRRRSSGRWRRFGRLDVLVANAGIGQHGSLVDAEWEHLETVLRTNIDGALHSLRACVPAMRKNGGGQILLISSVVAGLHTPYTADVRGEQGLCFQPGGLAAIGTGELTISA